MATYPAPASSTWLNGELGQYLVSNFLASSTTPATVSDLTRYANLFLPNVFQATNLFTSIQFTGTINNISATSFSYIGSLISDAQGQIDALTASVNETLTNWFYDASANSQGITNNLAVTGDVTAIRHNSASVRTQSVRSVSATIGSLTAGTIVCDSLEANNQTAAFLFNGSAMWPLLPGATSVVAWGLDSAQPSYITVASGFSASVLGSNGVLLVVKNAGRDWVHRQEIVAQYITDVQIKRNS